MCVPVSTVMYLIISLFHFSPSHPPELCKILVHSNLTEIETIQREFRFPERAAAQ